MFFVRFDGKRGWRILADYRFIGGDVIDICGAVNRRVATETVTLLNLERN